jgi:prevent-host-death family protein
MTKKSPMVVPAKGVPLGEAKAKLSSLVNAVAYGGERVIIESRGRPKAALVSVRDLERLEGTRPGRPSKAQRRLALAQAGRVRKALEGFRLTDSLADLQQLREERLRARG